MNTQKIKELIKELAANASFEVQSECPYSVKEESVALIRPTDLGWGIVIWQNKPYEKCLTTGMFLAQSEVGRQIIHELGNWKLGLILHF